jgi:hypothetical protein
MILKYQAADQESAVELGTAGAEEAVAAFDRIPWIEERKAASLLQKCSPSLFLEDKEKRLFFVSVLGGQEDQPLDFMIFLEEEAEVEVRRWFRTMTETRRESYDSWGHDEQKCREAICAFCEGRIDAVLDIIESGHRS